MLRVENREMIKEVEEELERELTTKEKEIIKLQVINYNLGFENITEADLMTLVSIHNQLSIAHGEDFITVKDGKYFIDGIESSRNEIIDTLDFMSVGEEVKESINKIRQLRIKILDIHR